MKRINVFLAIFFVFASFMMPKITHAQLNLLSGTEGGTYFNLANDIVKISSQPINVLTSLGSMDNFHQLNSNPDILVTFMQYDVLLANELIRPETRDEIHVLFPLFLDEEIHLITRKDSKINKLEDLRGKKVGVGSNEEGTRVTAQTIKNKTGIAWKDIDMPTTDAQAALMNGEIDAYFYVVGMPSSNLAALVDTTNIKLVSITHKNLTDIYKKKVIPAGTYKWQPKAITTFAVPTLLVVKVKEMSLENEKKVNLLLTEMKANIAKLQTQGHPKWKSVYFKSQEINWTYYYMRNKVE